MRKLLLATLALGLLVACSGAGAPTGAGGAPGIGRDGGPESAEFAKGAAAPGTDQAATQPNSIPIPAAADPTRALILTASIAMRAQDPWGAADRAQAVATSLGGEVMSMSQSGKGDDRSASVVLRVPADRFNDALRQLRALSDVEVLSSSVDSKDVTEQFVDRKSTRLNSSHSQNSYAVFCLKKNTPAAVGASVAVATPPAHVIFGAAFCAFSNRRAMPHPTRPMGMSQSRTASPVPQPESSLRHRPLVDLRHKTELVDWRWGAWISGVLARWRTSARGRTGLTMMRTGPDTMETVHQSPECAWRRRGCMRRILIGFLVATTLLVSACKTKTEGGNVVQ